jgi:hypothetical protein
VVGPDPGCQPQVGPIGTLPWYYEHGLVSDGDPALAFGPKPDSSGHFSWDNGSRLYYANLTSNFNAKRSETFKGFESVYVSRTDDPQGAAANDKSAWMAPVRVSKQSSATFADKEQIWADNAASSPFFGRAYVCWENFVGNGAGALDVATSTDGGNSWSQKQVTPAGPVRLHDPHRLERGCLRLLRAVPVALQLPAAARYAYAGQVVRRRAQLDAANGPVPDHRSLLRAQLRRQR